MKPLTLQYTKIQRVDLDYYGLVYVLSMARTNVVKHALEPFITSFSLTCLFQIVNSQLVKNKNFRSGTDYMILIIYI